MASCSTIPLHGSPLGGAIRGEGGSLLARMRRRRASAWRHTPMQRQAFAVPVSCVSHPRTHALCDARQVNEQRTLSFVGDQLANRVQSCLDLFLRSPPDLRARLYHNHYPPDRTIWTCSYPFLLHSIALLLPDIALTRASSPIRHRPGHDCCRRDTDADRPRQRGSVSVPPPAHRVSHPLEPPAVQRPERDGP